MNKLRTFVSEFGRKRVIARRIITGRWRAQIWILEIYFHQKSNISNTSNHIEIGTLANGWYEKNFKYVSKFSYLYQCSKDSVWLVYSLKGRLFHSIKKWAWLNFTAHTYVVGDEHRDDDQNDGGNVNVREPPEKFDHFTVELVQADRRVIIWICVLVWRILKFHFSVFLFLQR